MEFQEYNKRYRPFMTFHEDDELEDNGPTKVNVDISTTYHVVKYGESPLQQGFLFNIPHMALCMHKPFELDSTLRKKQAPKHSIAQILTVQQSNYELFKDFLREQDSFRMIGGLDKWEKLAFFKQKLMDTLGNWRPIAFCRTQPIEEHQQGVTKAASYRQLVMLHATTLPVPNIWDLNTRKNDHLWVVWKYGDIDARHKFRFDASWVVENPLNDKNEEAWKGLRFRVPQLYAVSTRHNSLPAEALWCWAPSQNVTIPAVKDKAFLDEYPPLTGVAFYIGQCTSNVGQGVHGNLKDFYECPVIDHLQFGQTKMKGAMTIGAI
jgi:hypothetical protein